MDDYYHANFQKYYEETVHIQPESFLLPLADRLRPGACVLDAGCGSGRDLLWLKQRGFHVIGLERSPGLAQLARKHAKCEVIEADFRFFDFSQFSVDAMVLIGALVHIPHEELPDVFENILHALRPGGHVLVSMKQGTGTKAAKDGRIFYLWQDDELRQVVAQKKCQVADFSVQVSAIRAEDVWLGYVLAFQAADSLPVPVIKMNGAQEGKVLFKKTGFFQENPVLLKKAPKIQKPDFSKKSGFFGELTCL